MKKISLILMSFILAAFISKAQPGQRNFSPEEMAKRQTAQIKEAVDLNTDQEKKVYDLNFETSKKMRTLRDENQGGGFEGMREEMNELRAEQDKKMKEILTDGQWKKYEKYRKEQRARWQNRGPGGR